MTHEEAEKALKDLEKILLDIKKSGLLHRIFYVGEEMRTEICPTHKGRMDSSMWVGLTQAQGREICECQGTGWLPNKKG